MNKSVISTTPPSYGLPQARMDRKLFDDFITDKGSNCYIERALKCPCIVKGSGSALSSCQNCGGTGWLFINRQVTLVNCTSLSNRTKYEIWTEANMGIVNISCRPEDMLGRMDKVVLTDLESWFSQILYLIDTPSDNTKAFAFLIYEPIDVFEVYVFNGSTAPLTYLDPSNYSIDKNKILVKKTAISGIESPCITLRYTHRPTYHIIDINRDIVKQKSGALIDAGRVMFPQNCIGRRAHFVLDTANFTGDNLFDNTNYDVTSPKYDR